MGLLLLLFSMLTGDTGDTAFRFGALGASDASPWLALLVTGAVNLALWTLCWRMFRNWKANAYRRQALRELETVNGVASIAEVLKRTALAVVWR